jgi:hypothetical protein
MLLRYLMSDPGVPHRVMRRKEYRERAEKIKAIEDETIKKKQPARLQDHKGVPRH